MRRDTIAVQGFLLECFCTTAMFILENVVDGKKTENLIGRGGKGEGGVGIRMSWVEKFRKIN